MNAKRIPTTRTPPRKTVRNTSGAEGLVAGRTYTVSLGEPLGDPNKLTIDELRNIITGVIPPKTLIKFSRMLTIALEEDQARLNVLDTLLPLDREDAVAQRRPIRRTTRDGRDPRA